MPFELGRPFGPPNDRNFQLDVLRSTLALLAEPSGPVIHDYPFDAPASAEGDEAWACALPARPQPAAANDAEALEFRLLAEIAHLRPWYDEAHRASGRTALGLSGIGASGVDAAARILAAAAAGADPAALGSRMEGMPMALRFVADDLKTFYFEAATAQPGRRRPTSAELNQWLFGETVLGGVIYETRDRLSASEDQSLKMVSRFLIPAAFARRPAAG